VVSVDVPSERLLEAVRYLSTVRPGHDVRRAQRGWDFTAAWGRAPHQMVTRAPAAE
jgi:hypothetical protein